MGASLRSAVSAAVQAIEETKLECSLDAVAALAAMFNPAIGHFEPHPVLHAWLTRTLQQQEQLRKRGAAAAAAVRSRTHAPSTRSATDGADHAVGAPVIQADGAGASAADSA